MARRQKSLLPPATPPPRPAPQTWSEKRDDVVLQAIAWQRYYDAFKVDAASLSHDYQKPGGCSSISRKGRWQLLS